MRVKRVTKKNILFSFSVPNRNDPLYKTNMKIYIENGEMTQLNAAQQKNKSISKSFFRM